MPQQHGTALPSDSASLLLSSKGSLPAAMTNKETCTSGHEGAATIAYTPSLPPGTLARNLCSRCLPRASAAPEQGRGHHRPRVRGAGSVEERKIVSASSSIQDDARGGRGAKSHSCIYQQTASAYGWVIRRRQSPGAHEFQTQPCLNLTRRSSVRGLRNSVNFARTFAS